VKELNPEGSLVVWSFGANSLAESPLKGFPDRARNPASSIIGSSNAAYSSNYDDEKRAEAKTRRGARVKGGSCQRTAGGDRVAVNTESPEFASKRAGEPVFLVPKQKHQ
jgi:hypothetical protein